MSKVILKVIPRSLSSGVYIGQAIRKLMAVISVDRESDHHIIPPSPKGT